MYYYPQWQQYLDSIPISLRCFRFHPDVDAGMYRHQIKAVNVFSSILGSLRLLDRTLFSCIIVNNQFWFVPKQRQRIGPERLEALNRICLELEAANLVLPL